jgi:hypothetical protein
MKLFIKKWSEFILNETLKTHNIDLTVSNVKSELALLNYNFNIGIKQNNTISLELLDYRYIIGIELYLDVIDNLFIDRHGWFPSKMIITNFSGMVNEFSYDEDMLKSDNSKYFQTVEIIYESKYDIETNIPKKLFHLSIQEYKTDILKYGLVPKSKNKLSKHLDRIYVCENINDCYNLINRMKINYFANKMKNSKNKINDKWIIYEIDSSRLNIKLYKDPNYNNGFYIIDNIIKDLVNIVDYEK